MARIVADLRSAVSYIYTYPPLTDILQHMMYQIVPGKQAEGVTNLWVEQLQGGSITQGPEPMGECLKLPRH
jgi:hypothetical protein